MTTIRELGEADKAAWNEFVGSNPYGDALQAWEWARVKADGGAWRPLRWGAFNGKGELVGGAAVTARRFPVVGTLYYAPRGPLLADWSDEGTLAALLDAVRERGRRDQAIALKIDPAVPVAAHGPAAAVPSLLERHGFRRPAGQDAQGFGGTQPRAVMVLPVADRSDEQLLAGFRESCRRNVRKAAKLGVEVVWETTREEHLRPFYDILQVTAERDGFTVRPFRYYEVLWEQLVENGLGKLFLTRYEGQYLSGALCFVIGDKCWYVYGASSNEHRQVMPNFAMQWAMIRWSRDIGCATYDFRGVAPVKPGEESTPEAEHLQGLNRFKEGFGARFVEYIGEYDLPLDPARYWAWTTGKPAAQRVMRRLRGRK